MVDMALIGGIANSLNIAVNISKLAIGLRDQALIQEKVVELTSQIMSVQQAAISAVTAQTALTERISELEKQIMDMETWETEKQNYELKAVVPYSFAYALKADTSSTEPPHWLCRACYQNSKRSILSVTGQVGRDNKWSCPICSTTILVPGNYTPSNPNGAFTAR